MTDTFKIGDRVRWAAWDAVVVAIKFDARDKPVYRIQFKLVDGDKAVTDVFGRHLSRRSYDHYINNLFRNTRYLFVCDDSANVSVAERGS